MRPAKVGLNLLLKRKSEKEKEAGHKWEGGCSIHQQQQRQHPVRNTIQVNTASVLTSSDTTVYLTGAPHTGHHTVLSSSLQHLPLPLSPCPPGHSHCSSCSHLPLSLPLSLLYLFTRHDLPLISFIISLTANHCVAVDHSARRFSWFTTSRAPSFPPVSPALEKRLIFLDSVCDFSSRLSFSFFFFFRRCWVFFVTNGKIWFLFHFTHSRCCTRVTDYCSRCRLLLLTLSASSVISASCSSSLQLCDNHSVFT